MADTMIALDVGGTKTEAILFEASGDILRRAYMPGANPLIIGFEAARDTYVSILRSMQKNSPGNVVSAYCGIPAAQYFGDAFSAAFRAALPIPLLRAEPDGVMLISAALGHRDGASLVCGTGSGMCFRSRDDIECIGGWGWLIDGCGSGYILGLRAIRAAIREADGRGEKTCMTQLLAERCREPITCHLPRLYEGGRAYFASFADIIFKAAALGDAVAQNIMDDCAKDLAEMVQTAYRRKGAFTLALNGGIFQAFPQYARAVQSLSPKDVTMLSPDAPPVYGAAVEAAYSAGIACDERFKTRFLARYAQCVPS